MSNIDNLYILDESNNQNTFKILYFFNETAQIYKSLLGHGIRIYRISPIMLNNENIKQKLLKKSIDGLPALFISGSSRTIIGVDNIIHYCETLYHQKSQEQQANSQDCGTEVLSQSIPGIDDESSVMNYYKNEILGTNQEKDEAREISESMSREMQVKSNSRMQATQPPLPRRKTFTDNFEPSMQNEMSNCPEEKIQRLGQSRTAITKNIPKMNKSVLHGSDDSAIKDSANDNIEQQFYENLINL